MKQRVMCLLIALAASSTAGAATFQVTRTDDPAPDGCTRHDCSLREAVLAANTLAGADVIVLGAATYTLSRTSSEPAVDSRGPLVIREALEIRGAGRSKTRVRWSQLSFLSRGMGDAVFYSSGTAPFGEISLRGLAISHGRGQNGGCVHLGQQFGDFTLGDLLIENCHAATGGGIALWGETVALSRVLIRDNTASSDGGGLSAIRDLALLLDHVEIVNNTATRHGGGLHLVQFDLDNPSTQLLQDLGGSRIAGNVAGGSGGGIAIRGDLHVDLIGDLDLLQIADNVADDEGGGVWRGPRYVAVNPLRTFLAHAQVRGNRAMLGGGVASSAHSALTLQNVGVTNNVAQDGLGGGVWLADGTATALLQRVSLHANQAFLGGGLYAGCGSATLQNVSLQENFAADGAALDAGGNLLLSHVTAFANAGPGTSVNVRDDSSCTQRHVQFTNSLIADSCAVAHGGKSSAGGNLYGPATLSCPLQSGLDRRRGSNLEFGLSAGDFGGVFPITGWASDGLTRPQQDFIGGGAWCLGDDVRGELRNDGACDSGAFEAP